MKLFQMLNLWWKTINSSPFRTDRNKKGGRKMHFIGKELLAKRLEDFETKSTETICIELLMYKKKWCVIFTYRLSKCNKKVLFQELSKTVSSVSDNILVAGDLNIDVSRSKRLNDNHLSEMIDTFKITNLVKNPTCFKTARGTLLEVLLTNKLNSWQKTGVCEAGLSDCHKMVFASFRLTFIRLTCKIIKHGNYIGFDENIFVMK